MIEIDFCSCTSLTQPEFPVTVTIPPDNQKQHDSCNNQDLDITLVNSFKSLLKLYSMHVAESDRACLVSGGMQQYLIRNSQHKTPDETSSQPRKHAGSETATFHDLPVR